MPAETTTTGSRSTRLVTVASIKRWVRTLLSALSFWSAIVLPVLYVPLFVEGLNSTGLLPLLVLVTLHSIALIGGREYKQDTHGRNS